MEPMYKIARLILSEKNVYKDKKNNILKKCIILCSKEPSIFIKCKKKFTPNDIYIRIKFENNIFTEWTFLGTVGNESDDIKIFYHLFTIGWITNTKLNKIFTNYLNDNIHFDNAVTRENYEHQVITVDPQGATDLDDGFTLNDNDEFYNLDIHIADPVSYFVPGSEFTNVIMNEINKRISTCYIEESCHLFPVSFVKIVSFLIKDSETQKRSMSFIFKINKNTNKVDLQIKPLKLLNIKNLSYEEFQQICDNDSNYKNKLYQLVIMLINIMKLNYNTDSLNIDFSHKVIEIFMLFTNWSVGNYLNTHSKFFIARIQKMFCDKEALINAPNYATTFLNFSANYSIINTTNNVDTLTHFSLGLDNYAHISSPMRRFIDFVNHLIIYNSVFGLNNSYRSECELMVTKIINNINIDNINEIIKKQKKISSSYQILKYIKSNSNTFKACILDYTIYNDNVFVLIVLHNELNDFKKIINTELPINSNIKLEKFHQFNVQLFYNSINYKSSKFPFSIKII
jgi:exoribonuclease R